MPGHVREYLAMVAKSYGTRVAGPILACVALVLGIVSAVYANDPSVGVKIARTSAWITGGIACAFIFIAQYDVWRNEREKCEAEKAKNTKPELKGIIYGFSVGIHGGGTGPDGCHAGAELRFMIEVCNHRPVATNIRSLSLDGSRIDSTLSFSKIVLSGTPSRLEQGIVHRFAGSCSADVQRPDPSIPGRWPDQIEMQLDQLIAILIDGFGEKHQLESGGSVTF